MDHLNAKEIPLYLRVLGYPKSGKWAAHCLETDLVGYGETFEEALEVLVELTDMQLSFAIFKNQPSLLDKPAPPWIIEAYIQGLRSCLEYFDREEIAGKRRYFTGIPLTHKSIDTDFAFA